MKGEKILERYYTFEYLNDPTGCEYFKICNFADSLNVKIGNLTYDCRDKLAEIGVNLLNEQHSIENFQYPASCDKAEIDELEKKIKEFAETLHIKIHDVRASLDYNKIIPFATSGMEVLLEDIIVPSSKAQYEARVKKYIDELDSQGKTLILTDPYLFSTSSPDYVSELEEYLRWSGAVKIMCLMPLRCKNNVYSVIEARLSPVKFEFHEYSECHDRFWLCPENKTGFCMGTSLNGLGRKICRIDMLEITEVEVLIQEISSALKLQF